MPPPAGQSMLRPVKDFRGAFLHAISADGKKMCVVLSPEAAGIWTFGGGRWTPDEDSTLPKDAPFCVIEIGPWKASYSTKLDSAPFVVSFFRDTSALYVTGLFLDAGKAGNQQVVIDLGAEKIKQREVRTGLFRTTRGQRLLTTTWEPGKAGALRIVELPDYREVKAARGRLPSASAQRS